MRRLAKPIRISLTLWKDADSEHPCSKGRPGRLFEAQNMTLNTSRQFSRNPKGAPGLKSRYAGIAEALRESTLALPCCSRIGAIRKTGVSFAMTRGGVTQ